MTKVVVCGGAHVDRRGRISGLTAPGASNPGSWFSEAGGGGFNAARNLARLELSVTMISPRGGDAEGDMVTAAAEQAGVIDRPFIFLDRRTPSYTAILENDGNLVIALADMELYKLFTPRRAAMRAIRDAIADGELLLCDANLPEETILALTRQAKGLGKRVAGIAISPAKVVRYRQAIGLLDFLFMNEAEARALAGRDVADMAEWPGLLRAAGLRGGVVTRGGKSLVAFDGENAALLAPPFVSAVDDVTGAGDSLAAGTIFGLMGGLDIAQAARLGIACAAITLQSPYATSDLLSQDSMRTALMRVPEAQAL